MAYELPACRRVGIQGSSARTSAQQRMDAKCKEQKLNSIHLAGTKAEK